MVKNNSQKGFTLAELMIGLGVAAVVTLSMIDVTRIVSRGSRGAQIQSNANVIASLISQNLRFQSTCASTFKNGGADIPYDRNQALFDDPANLIDGMPIALTLPGIRAGAGANVSQITGLNNAVGVGAAPAFAGATSDLSIYGLEVVRIAFVQLAESGTQRFGYVYLDTRAPNTSTIIGGNAVRRKVLGGVVLDAAGATVTNCFGNSPQSDLATICTGLGCNWNAGTSACTCSKAEVTCGPGELFWGVSDLGLPVCKFLGGGSCPPGQYVSGMGLERVICSAVPDEPVVLPSTDCAGGPVSWVVGANTCTGAIGAVANGVSATVTATGTNTGSAVFTCSSGTLSAPTSTTCNAPPSCPAGTSTTGLGAVASPISCICNNAGETWNGTNCVAPTPCTCPDIPQTGSEYLTACSPGTVISPGVCEVPAWSLRDYSNVSLMGSCDHNPQTCPIAVTPPSGVGIGFYFGAITGQPNWIFNQQEGPPTAVSPLNQAPRSACYSLGYTITAADEFTPPFDGGAYARTNNSGNWCYEFLDGTTASPTVIWDGAGEFKTVYYIKP